ncbi:hypothetical protein ABIA35_009077 [Catenulispora sp. MAP12-49]|uniref:hypothetical protein n=1 Tax=Catenulispora sp. MAP12-49 TaxID=3156302 RepID=UPI003512B7C9
MGAVGQSIPSQLCCPGCGQVEQVQRVPAAYQEGQGWYGGTSATIGVAAGRIAYGYGIHEGATITALASALAPAPALRRVGGFLATALFFVPVLVVGVWLGLTVSRHGAPASSNGLQKGSYDFGAWMVPAFFSLPLIGFLAAVVARVRRNSRIRSGQSRAVGVWSHGCICRRCGGVFFPVGTPLEVPTGQVMSVASFRRIVWSAGGYDTA